MKKLLLFLFCLLCLCSISSAQKAPIKWGKIDKEDLLMKVYPLDSSASAVVLADYGVAYFTFSDDKGFQLNMDRHTRIKILTTNGLDNANQRIPLFHKDGLKEEVAGLKAFTYNLEGGKVKKDKMDKKAVFSEAYDERIDFLKFTLPNVKEGAVIEFKYTLKTDFIYNFFTWEFQRDIPVQWSEFRAKVPEYFAYKNLMSGYLPVTVVESTRYQDSFNYRFKETVKEVGSLRGDRTREKTSIGVVKPEGTAYRWAMENVPAIKEEAYITTIQDYLSKIEFELNYTKYPGSSVKMYSNTWENLAEEFMKDPRFGGQLAKDRYLREVVAGLQEKASGAELVGEIVLFVKKNLNYNGKERVYPEKSLKQAFDAKEGNAAEINLLLTLMLREAGFEANPVILSTRSHGRVNPVIPLERDFNFVLSSVLLDGSNVLLDGTHSSLPVGMLPFNCLNQQGRLIGEGFTSWVPLHSNEIIKESSQATFSLTATGSLSGTLKRKHEGYSAVFNRIQFQEQGEEKYQKEKYNDKGWKVTEFAIENADILSNELTENVTLDMQEAVTVAGDRIYFQPMLMNRESENPLKLEARSFPVDFGCPVETLSMVKIKLPEGYIVEEMPESAVISLPDKSGTFRYGVNVLGNELTVVHSLKFSKPLYLPEEYLALKKIYELVVAKHAEQVVLKKSVN